MRRVYAGKDMLYCKLQAVAQNADFARRALPQDDRRGRLASIFGTIRSRLT